MDKKTTKASCYIAVLIAVLITISLLAGCGNSSAAAKVNAETGTLLTMVNNDTLYIADHDGNIYAEDFYGEIYSEQTSMDGTKYMVIDDDDGMLIYFNGEEIQKIADYVDVAVMSADGNTIAYITCDGENETSELYRYAGGESVLIDSGMLFTCVISPDGSAIGYTTKDEEGIFRSYYWDGAEDRKEIGKNRGIIAISNKGEYVYYVKLDDYGNEDGCYVQHGEDSTTKKKLIEDISTAEAYFYFNADATEFMFWDGVKNLISVKGEDLIEMENGFCRPLLPTTVQMGSAFHQGHTYTVCGIDSFAGAYYSIDKAWGQAYNLSYKKIVYLNEEFEAVEVAAPYSDAYLCEDGKTIIYTSDDGTYKFDSTDTEAGPEMLFAGSWLAIGNDGKSIYYYTEDNQINRIDGSKASPEPTTVFEGAAGNEIVFLDAEKDMIYLRSENGDLLVLDGDGTEDNLISGLESNLRCEQYCGKLILTDGIRLFCIDGKTTKEISGVVDAEYYQFWLNDCVLEADGTLLAVYPYGRENSAGCYVSVDGENFQPLVPDYDFWDTVDMIEMPDFVGMNMAEAEELAKQYSLRISSPIFGQSIDEVYFIVTEQSAAAGSEWPKTAEKTIVLYCEPDQEQMLMVPDFSGATMADIEYILMPNTELKITFTGKTDGVVCEQSVSAGEMVLPGTVIELTLEYGTGSMSPYAWKTAYIQQIEEILSYEDPFYYEVDGFRLVYLDRDDIPELVVNSFWGFSVFSYSGGELSGVEESGAPLLQLGNGLVMAVSGRQGEYEDTVYRLDETGFHLIGSGLRLETAWGSNEYYCTWNDQSVSEEEYDQLLKSAFDSSQASDLDTQAVYSDKEAIEEAIRNWQAK